MDFYSLRGGGFCTTIGVLTASGADTLYDTANAILHVNDGKIRSKAAVVGGTTPTTDANTGVAFASLTANKGAVAVWGLNAAGTVRVAQGPIADLDVQGNFKWDAPQFPPIPSDFVPFAYQVLKAGATAGTITFGTSNWNATGFTQTIQDVSYLPSRPAVS